jgi:hypothetical protein
MPEPGAAASCITTVIEFNLACYASAAGRLEEAKNRLQRALEFDGELRRAALDDPDLEPLWSWIANVE